MGDLAALLGNLDSILICVMKSSGKNTIAKFFNKSFGDEFGVQEHCCEVIPRITLGGPLYTSAYTQSLSINSWESVVDSI